MFCFVFVRKFWLIIVLHNSCSIRPTSGGTCQNCFTKHHECADTPECIKLLFCQNMLHGYIQTWDKRLLRGCIQWNRVINSLLCHISSAQSDLRTRRRANGRPSLPPSSSQWRSRGQHAGESRNNVSRSPAVVQFGCDRQETDYGFRKLDRVGVAFWVGFLAAFS